MTFKKVKLNQCPDKFRLWRHLCTFCTFCTIINCFKYQQTSLINSYRFCNLNWQWIQSNFINVTARMDLIKSNIYNDSSYFFRSGSFVRATLFRATFVRSWTNIRRWRARSAPSSSSRGPSSRWKLSVNSTTNRRKKWRCLNYFWSFTLF